VAAMWKEKRPEGESGDGAEDWWTEQGRERGELVIDERGGAVCTRRRRGMRILGESQLPEARFDPFT